MAGRKKTPDHLKVVSGTARPDRMNADAPVAPKGLPTAPDWLTDRQVELFNQLACDVDDLGVGSKVNSWMLTQLAIRYEEIIDLSIMIEDYGRTYETTNGQGGRMIRSRPEVGQRNEAMRHAQSLLSEFGLSPAALSKVSTGGKSDANPFEALG